MTFKKFAFNIFNSPIGRVLGKHYYEGSGIHPLISHYFDKNFVGSGITPRFDLAGTNRFTRLAIFLRLKERKMWAGWN